MASNVEVAMSGQPQVGCEWPFMLVHNKKQFKQNQAKNKNKQTNKHFN